ncbi:MAG: phosphate acyltransferase PlsX [Planctomycetes bacterium]|jgi:glycerol-3-phosphate acyltransferase PlsX|nr:phosphate acyltransferase PlsX [Planctomycetota bacterium]
MTKVVLDAFGGDHAPKECVAGVALAMQRGYVRADQLILTGPIEALRSALREQGVPFDGLTLVDAPDVLTDQDSPTDAMRKKPRNSIALGLQQVKEGRAGAFVSAGSTGTVVAAATLGLGCLEGIKRPAIGAIIEGEKHPFLVVDVGANPQPKAYHLAQYALMGSAYYGGTFGIAEPKVGILNIGSEELKGNPLVREARGMMKQLPIAFHGNVEGLEVFSGDCHVVVTDGFTGNVLLKVSEGVAEYLLRVMFGLMQKAGVEPAKMKQVQAGIMPRVDFAEYGGALLLGVQGVVTICHGRSRAPAFANAIRFAMKAMAAEVNRHIVQAAKALVVPGAEPNG